MSRINLGKCWGINLSVKQDKGWLIAAAILMFLWGGGNALIGGLGVARIYPLWMDEYISYEESVRDLMAGLVMLVLAVVTLWRRAQAAVIFAGLIVGGSFVFYVASGEERIVVWTQAGFTLLFLLLMVKAWLSLRREAKV